jgi:hypothetical protein
MRSINAWLFITLDGVVEAPENWVMPVDAQWMNTTRKYSSP